MNNMQTIKKKFSILHLMPIVISLFALGAVGYFWLNNSSLSYAAGQKADVSAPPIFLNLAPFTVTLPKQHDDYIVNKVLYIGMTLRLASEEHKQILTDYLPEVRSQLLLLLASQDINELNTEVGKLRLMALVKQLLSRQYNGGALVSVDDVLFTDFIIR